MWFRWISCVNTVFLKVICPEWSPDSALLRKAAMGLLLGNISQLGEHAEMCQWTQKPFCHIGFHKWGRKKCASVDSLFHFCCRLVFIQVDFNSKVARMNWKQNGAKSNKCQGAFVRHRGHISSTSALLKLALTTTKIEKTSDVTARTECRQLLNHLSSNVSKVSCYHQATSHLLCCVSDGRRLPVSWVLRLRAEVKDKFLHDDGDMIHFSKTGAQRRPGPRLRSQSWNTWKYRSIDRTHRSPDMVKLTVEGKDLFVKQKTFGVKRKLIDLFERVEMKVLQKKKWWFKSKGLLL